MDKQVMYNRKTGELGLRMCLGERGFKDKNWGDGTEEWNSNYAIFPMDPVMFTWDSKNRVHTTTDWIRLPETDPRVQYVTLFDVIEGGLADWKYDTSHEDCIVEYAHIENPHEVFQLIRKIFSN